MRSLGIVATDAQARVCHGPTVSALASTFGRGAMTNTFVDIQHADMIMVMGGNAAEAHPVGFKWVIEAKKKKGTKLYVVDPRFNRTAAVADFYAPLRSGSDIAFLGALINWLIENDKIQWEYVKAYTNASFIVAEGVDFDEGMFSGYNEGKKQYNNDSWFYELDADGYAQTDPTLQHPRCVYQWLKRHYAGYTPEKVESICGTPKEKFLHVCEKFASTAQAGRVATIMYALGWTQHTTGAQMLRTGALVQLLCGNIGVAGGGMNALRGHSNIQGLTDLGILSASLPGYPTLPNEKEQDYEQFIATRTPTPSRSTSPQPCSNASAPPAAASPPTSNTSRSPPAASISTGPASPFNGATCGKPCTKPAACCAPAATSRPPPARPSRRTRDRRLRARDARSARRRSRCA